MTIGFLVSRLNARPFGLLNWVDSTLAFWDSGKRNSYVPEHGRHKRRNGNQAVGRNGSAESAEGG